MVYLPEAAVLPLLDFVIAASYLTIPVLLLKLNLAPAQAPAKVAGFPKCHSPMSQEDCKLVHRMMAAFSMFIITSGLGHGLGALHGFTGLYDFELLRQWSKFLTAGVSVGASIYIHKGLPQLHAWLSEIQGRGAAPVMLEEARESEESKASLRARIAHLEDKISQLQDVKGSEMPTGRTAVEEAAENPTLLVSESRKGPLKAAFVPFHDEQRTRDAVEKVAAQYGLNWKQTAMIFAALLQLHVARDLWRKKTEGTWGVFRLTIGRAMRRWGPATTTPVDKYNWHIFTQWCATEKPQKMTMLLTTAIAFHYSQSEDDVVRLSTLLKQ